MEWALAIGNHFSLYEKIDERTRETISVGIAKKRQ